MSSLAIVGALVLTMMGIVAALMVVSSWRKVMLYQRLAATLFVINVLLGAHRIFFDELSTWHLGGLAAQGKVEFGRHFVGEHGRYHEVRPEQWDKNLMYDHVSEYLEAGALIALLIALLVLGFFRQRAANWSLATMMRSGGRRREK